MATQSQMLSEIADTIVLLMDHMQIDVAAPGANLGINNPHNPLVVNFTATLALAYANISHGPGHFELPGAGAFTLQATAETASQ